MDELSVRVIPFSKEQCPFNQKHVHTWKEWHSFRNGVIDILLRHGSVGPLGKLPILETYEESANEWHVSTHKPDFFVVDEDMYGDSVRVETRPTLVRPPLLDELLMLVMPTQDWSVYLALVKGGLWVFSKQVFFEGNFFADCGSLADLYHRCALGADSQARSC